MRKSPFEVFSYWQTRLSTSGAWASAGKRRARKSRAAARPAGGPRRRGAAGVVGGPGGADPPLEPPAPRSGNPHTEDPQIHQAPPTPRGGRGKRGARARPACAPDRLAALARVAVVAADQLQHADAVQDGQRSAPRQVGPEAERGQRHARVDLVLAVEEADDARLPARAGAGVGRSVRVDDEDAAAGALQVPGGPS